MLSYYWSFKKVGQKKKKKGQIVVSANRQQRVETWGQSPRRYSGTRQVRGSRAEDSPPRRLRCRSRTWLCWEAGAAAQATGSAGAGSTGCRAPGLSGARATLQRPHSPGSGPGCVTSGARPGREGASLGAGITTLMMENQHLGSCPSYSAWLTQGRSWAGGGSGGSRPQSSWSETPACHLLVPTFTYTKFCTRNTDAQWPRWAPQINPESKLCSPLRPSPTGMVT